MEDEYELSQSKKLRKGKILQKITKYEKKYVTRFKVLPYL